MRAIRTIIAIGAVLSAACAGRNQIRNQTFGSIPVVLPRVDSVIVFVGKSDSLILPFKGPKNWTKLVWFTQIGSAIRIKSYDLYSPDTTENDSYNNWNLVIRYSGTSRGWSYLTFEPDGFPSGSSIIMFSVTKPTGEITLR